MEYEKTHEIKMNCIYVLHLIIYFVSIHSNTLEFWLKCVDVQLCCFLLNVQLSLYILWNIHPKFRVHQLIENIIVSVLAVDWMKDFKPKMPNVNKRDKC